MYETIIREFTNMDQIKLSNPAPIKEMVLMALDAPAGGWKPNDGDKPSIAEYCKKLLISKAAMLLEYFSITITSDGMIETLPEIVEHYCPPLVRLPLFLLKLAIDTNWTSEQMCFRTVSMQIADFYKVHREEMYLSYSKANDSTAGSTNSESPSLKWIIEHVLFPSFRISFTPNRKFAIDGSVTQIACLENLYKIFERC